jgi:voltage-gated potassium channel
VATVGFREVQPLSTGGKFFTMALILVGVSSTLYAFSVLLETLIEGRLFDSLGRRRMERSISSMRDHVIICGWGRVGRSIASEVDDAGRPLVVVDSDPDRLAECPYPTVMGDATQDAVLTEAGIERASSLIAAVDADAANSFIILSARAMRPDVFIVARARGADSEDKLRRAGADRVVNPQHIGGARMAAFVLRPHVAEFVDVVMHDRNLEFRLEELLIRPSSPIAGKSLRDAQVRDRTGALVLAVRESHGDLRTNPSPDTTLEAGDLLIAIGTESELRDLGALVEDQGR